LRIAPYCCACGGGGTPIGRKEEVKDTGAGGIGGTMTGGPGRGVGLGLGIIGLGVGGLGVGGLGGVDVAVAGGGVAVLGGVDGGGSRLSGGGATAAMVGERSSRGGGWGLMEFLQEEADSVVMCGLT
jgi:hypothetical protein